MPLFIFAIINSSLLLGGGISPGGLEGPCRMLDIKPGWAMSKAPSCCIIIPAPTHKLFFFFEKQGIIAPLVVQFSFLVNLLCLSAKISITSILEKFILQPQKQMVSQWILLHSAMDIEYTVFIGHLLLWDPEMWLFLNLSKSLISLILLKMTKTGPANSSPIYVNE